MRIRRALALAGMGVLGGAVVVLPGVAASETAPPGVVAENAGIYSHHWTPPSVTINPGGAVEFSNPTEVAHGIKWVSTPGTTPVCAAGVPVGTTSAASGIHWKGTCSFATAGTYTYYCTVHGNAMSGTITVATTTPETTPGTTPGTTPSTTPSTSSTPTTGAPGGATGPGAANSPAAELSALKLGPSGHGRSIHGSVLIAPAAAGGTLTIVLQARLGGHRVVVGRLTRARLSAGAQSWSVALSSRARRALHSKHRLPLSVKLSLTRPGGTAVSLTRTVTLHG
ncbi:MAG TPA: plastocyanin/azurin family copper-binding protein [Solirubrobacteraceae bacterium]